MPLPNADRAVVDIRKLREYALNPDHEVGRHKARVFASALGWTADDAELLREHLLHAARVSDPTFKGEDVHGRRFEVIFTIDGPYGPVKMVSGWIIRPGEEFARLTSCRVA